MGKRYPFGQWRLRLRYPHLTDEFVEYMEYYLSDQKEKIIKMRRERMMEELIKVLQIYRKINLNLQCC